MGKRELLLILAFIAIGAVVYQVSAPPGDPSKPGFSFSDMARHVESAMKGERAEAPIVRTLTLEPESGEAVSLKDYRGVLKVIAEERDDIQAELHATAFGLDEAMARQRAANISFKLEESGDRIQVLLDQPGNGRRARYELALRLPQAQAFELALRSGEAEIRGVTRVMLLDGRGKVTILDAEHVSGEFAGDLTVQRVDEVKLQASRGDVRFDDVRGSIEVEADRADLTLNKLAGPVRLNVKNLTCKMEDIDGATTIESTHGHIEVRDARAQLTVNGTDSEIIVSLAEAVETSITNTDGTIDLRVPKGGFKIDAATENGAIRTTWNGPAFNSTEKSQKFMFAREHGPLIKLRNEGGDIFLR